MERKTQKGYLVLADISGYTSFVPQTEIEHADIALSYLLETIVESSGRLPDHLQTGGRRGLLLLRGGPITRRQIPTGTHRSHLSGFSE